MYNYKIVSSISRKRTGGQGTCIVKCVFWENLKPLLKKLDKLLGHFLEFRHVAVCVDIAEACTHRVVNKQQVGKFVPRAVVVDEVLLVVYSVGANLHQCAVL